MWTLRMCACINLTEDITKITVGAQKVHPMTRVLSGAARGLEGEFSAPLMCGVH